VNAGGDSAFSNTAASGGATIANVVGRHVFLNDSPLDGNDPAADARDDGAIVAGKQPLVSGAAPSRANHTAFAQGINGIMIDVDGLPANAEAELTVDAFTFRTGAGGNPAGWAVAPAPTAVAVRRGAGAGGADRVSLVWADGTAAKNAWLQVTLTTGPATGLAVPDVFYFGNVAGDATGDRQVTVADVGALSTNFGMTGRTPEQGDFTGDGAVTVGDVGVLSSSFGRSIGIPLLGGNSQAASESVWMRTPASTAIAKSVADRAAAIDVTASMSAGLLGDADRGGNTAPSRRRGRGIRRV
jgi:hypothetical protein